MRAKEFNELAEMYFGQITTEIPNFKDEVTIGKLSYTNPPYWLRSYTGIDTMAKAVHNALTLLAVSYQLTTLDLSFEEYCTVTLTEAKNLLLGEKAKEYAFVEPYPNSSVDRLGNFYGAAKMNKVTPIMACDGMAVKHRVWIIDAINKDVEITEKKLRDHTVDEINYKLLRLAIHIEEHNAN